MVASFRVNRGRGDAGHSTGNRIFLFLLKDGAASSVPTSRSKTTGNKGFDNYLTDLLFDCSTQIPPNVINFESELSKGIIVNGKQSFGLFLPIW